MAIKFTNAERKAYPKVEGIKVGVKVIALYDTDYVGAEGVITDIKYGVDKETDKDSLLNIYVDFEEFSNTYSHIEQLIWTEDELGFKFDSEDNSFYETADGRAVCPHCVTPIQRVTETQYEEIVWKYVDGEYVKTNTMGSSDGKTCGCCGEFIEDPEEKLFRY